MYNLLSKSKHIILYTLLFALIKAEAEVIHGPGTLYLPDKAISLDDGYQLTLQGVFGGMTLLIVAFLLWFRGYWDSTPMGYHIQKLTGFIVIGFVTWVMLANFEPSQTYGVNRLTIYYIVPFSVGLLAIPLMSHTIHLYLMLLGGLGGLSIGLWVLGWKSGLTITSSWGRAILLTVLAIVFMLMSPRYMTCHSLGAALTGAYMLFMALDIFIHTGFLYVFTTTLDNNPNHAHYYETNRGVYIMQSCLIVASVVGYTCQVLCSRLLIDQHNLLLRSYIEDVHERKYIDYLRRIPHFPWVGHHQQIPPVQPNPVEQIV